MGFASSEKNKSDSELRGTKFVPMSIFSIDKINGKSSAPNK